jgi:hypothetical protein
MRSRAKLNTYMSKRREEMKAKGICVDCQSEPVKKAKPGRKPHTLCENCMEQRRDRARDARGRNMTLPLPLVYFESASL